MTPKESQKEQYAQYLKYAVGAVIIFFVIHQTLLTKRHNDAPFERVLTKDETVSAGRTDLQPYSLTVPKGWVVKRTNNEQADTLIIAKDAYKIEIVQKSKDEAYKCNVVKDMLYADLTNKDGTHYRRSLIQANPQATRTSNTICEQRNGEYLLPTEFGTINYDTPVQMDMKIIKEMDEMVISLKRG